jgi:hypothetical protein
MAIDLRPHAVPNDLLCGARQFCLLSLADEAGTATNDDINQESTFQTLPHHRTWVEDATAA